MCGIVGFTGRHQAAPILLDGLSKLEYRGYDSAGIAVRDGEGETEVIKAKGRLKVLSEKTNGGETVPGTCGFCLLDEIEAALDDSNVGRFAGYLQKLTKNTQFIIITHRRGTMNAADRLYGITMQEKGVSTLVSVDLVENQLTQ